VLGPWLSNTQKGNQVQRKKWNTKKLKNPESATNMRTASVTHWKVTKRWATSLYSGWV
jgi:hypothetical protein